MLVTKNTQLNILVANQTNKVFKEVLKEADVKTLTSQNKDLNVSTLLKTLFNNIQDNTKSNETVLNLLKNSNLNKDLGSFTSNLQSLIKSLPDNKDTEQLKVFLKEFAITPDQATPKEVKEQIQKSGIFLESKLLNQLNNPNPKNENSLLNDMKAVLLKTQAQIKMQIETQTKPESQAQTTTNQQTTINQSITKENLNTTVILKQIDKLLSKVNTIDSPAKTLPIFTKQKETQQLQQPIKNETNSILNEVKTLLLKIKEQLQPQKTEIQQNQTIPKENNNTSEFIKQVDKLITKLDNPELSIKNTIPPSEPKTATQQVQQANTLNIKNETTTLLNDVKTVLLNIKEQFQTQKIEIQQNQPQIQNQPTPKQPNTPTEIVKQIDKVLVKLDNPEILNKPQIITSEPKTIQQVQQSPTTIIKNETTNLLNEVKVILLKVKEEIQTQITPKYVETSNSKVEQTTSKPQITASTSQFLQMKVQLQSQPQIQNQAIPNENKNSKEMLKQIDKLLTQLNNFETSNSKEAPVKVAITTDTKQTQQMQQTINPQIIKSDSSLLNDIKTVLSKAQTQIQTQNLTQNQEEIKNQITKEVDPKESLKQIDKLLTQIDYHQLYSVVNSSNNVYIPFIWDLLEDGSIDIKKSDEEKFYCLIDLTLKDLGKLNLHLYLYEDDKLDISIFVEKDETKQLIRQKSTLLRQELNKTAINIIGLNIFTLKEDNKENIYKQDDNFDFGINIKA